MGRRTLAILALLPLVFSASIHAELAGSATVTDGDTLTVVGHRIRLFGIDAPESKQTCLAGGKRWRCGQSATQALARRIAGRPVVCSEHSARSRPLRPHRGGVPRKRCRPQRLDGLAGARPRLQPVLDGLRRAGVGREGRSAGTVARRVRPPWDWRQGKRLAAAAPTACPGACRIKGNISRSGKRIYHVPGAQYYGRTRIDTSKGERWFCSEAEARAAGWRRAKR